LFANYPNPFNPETWLPYQLSEDANVQIHIYDSAGHLVRDLDLGFQSSGFYLHKDSAAYWNGRNNAGEKLASGMYFYQLIAGDYTATRRLVIVK
jgi:flagellar hook assembly protein FlgD